MKIENDNFRKGLRILVMFLQKLIYLAMFILMGCFWLFLFFFCLIIPTSPEEITKFIPKNAAYYVLQLADFSYYYYSLVSIVILMVVFMLLYMPLEILHSTLESRNQNLPDKDIKNSALLSSGAVVLSSGGGDGGDPYNRGEGEEEGGDLEGD